MRQARIVILALVIFGSGALTGVFGTRLYVSRLARDIFAGKVETAQSLVLRRLDGELSLSAEQRRRLAPLIGEAGSRLAELRRRFAPEVDAILAETVRKMRAELTPEQGGRLEALLAAFTAGRDGAGTKAGE